MEDTYITGSSGFLGSHLATKLGRYTAIPHSQISSANVSKFDKFFFLSAYGNLIHQINDRATIQANIADLIMVLNSIDLSHKFKSFVYISTSSVRLKRQTMYSRTKKAAEEILLAYMEKYNLPICIIRPYSITGVGEQKEHLIPKLIDSCMNGIRMDFTPKAVHDFVDVDDVVEGILNLSAHGARGIFELGTGVGHSNEEVLKIVEKVVGKPVNVDVVEKLRDYDNTEWVSNNYRARMYGWLPKKSLEQSVKEMYEAAK